MELSQDELHIVERLANEPYLWIRQYVPEVKSCEEPFSDLVDKLKAIWEDIRKERINLCFTINWNPPNSSPASTIEDYENLQRQQNTNNSRLIFEINVKGEVLTYITMSGEIEPRVLKVLSQRQNCVIFWLGPEFEIYCKGVQWDPRDKHEILKDIKSKRRDKLIPLVNLKAIMQKHYEEYIRDQARVIYWHKKNESLLPNPERIFQQCIWTFFDREVACDCADREPMFKDSSRCDVRIFNDLDIYFIEVKWIGRSIKHNNLGSAIEASKPTEFDIDRAIDGAYQTKCYIEKNNSPDYNNRIKLGLLVVYDGFLDQRIPIDYGPEIKKCVLLDYVEFPLVTFPPSEETKGIAKKKGLV